MALSKWTNRKEVWGDQQADMKCDAPCRSPRGKGSSFKNATAEHLDERRQDWRGARSSRCLSRQNKRSLWKRYHPVWGTALVERVTFASAWISWVVHFILFHTCTHSQFRDAQFVFSKFEAARGRRRLDLRRGDPPQVTPREKRSYSHWCQTEGVSRLPVTGKSHLKVKKQK